ncbi:hypothetical protein WR25_25221 [Diploscapter pachys]|uniref:Uncharacterized protein n=1 Tax=Diploscapter pachys TaxID=2018661 RepID=A0A2A2KF92_9BILA|nr:hypothetical protein WR25_25221 [Diploscapter pachys]
MRKSRHSLLKNKSKKKKRSEGRRSEGTPEEVKDRDKQSASESHEKKRRRDESRQANAPNVSTEHAEQDSAPTKSHPTQPSSNFKPSSQPFQPLSSKPEYSSDELMMLDKLDPQLVNSLARGVEQPRMMFTKEIESTLGYRAMHAAHKEGLIMNPRKIIHMGNIDTIQRQRRMEGRKDDIDAELDRVIREQDTEDDSTQSNAYNVTFNDIGILYTTLPDQTDDDLTSESEEHVDFH